MTDRGGLRGLLREGRDILLAAGVPDAALDSEYLLAEVLKVPRLNLLFSASSPVPPGVRDAFLGLIRRRAGREPLQYILGSQPFYGREMLVGEGVLIPRADTESVCEQALALIPEDESVRVLDLCCGSGALGIALALERPRARVWASDISEKALTWAEKNVRRNRAPVTLLRGDLWEAAAGMTFDVVVSNPPYIPEGEMPLLQEEVKREPALALCGGADGLETFRRILSGLGEHLVPGGALCLECGDDETGALLGLLSPRFDLAFAFNDLSGRPRGVSGKGFRP